MPARSRSRLEELFLRSPFTREQRLRLISADGGQARIALEIGPAHTQGLARVHGGVVTALADTAATIAGYSSVEEDEDLLTTSLHMAFMAGAGEGDELVATATVIHAGRSTLVAEARVSREGRPAMAAGTFTMIRLRRGEGVTRAGG